MRELFDSPYDNENSFGATYGEHREALELDARRLRRAARPAAELDLVFFATAFDEASADLLKELDLPAYKIASGDLRNTPLLRHVASFGKPVLSTGGATLEDVDRAVETFLPLNPEVCVLQCTAAYPAGRRGAGAGRDHDVPRALPGPRGRPLRPPGRDRDVARRLHARRARDREALHAESRGEGHRPRVLADAGGHAEARARPPAHPGRDRRRRQAAAPERGEAAREDGEEARRGAAAPGGARSRRGDLVARLPADGGRRPTSSTASSGGPLAARSRRTRRSWR